ncbi:hypothetical protein SK34_04045 [Citrobacter sp. MGH104]|nr:hypothetical protein SK34_04045 [Citrobacter sp. MGH104]
MQYNPRIDINKLFSHPGFNIDENNVWYYEDHSRNVCMVWDMIKDLISQDAINLFINSDMDNFYSDDFTWIHDLCRISNTQYHNIPIILKERIFSTFKYIRCYHGTRTQNIDSFLSQGIKSFNPEELEEFAKKLFIEHEPNMTNEIFQAALIKSKRYKQARFDGNESGVNLVLNKHIPVSADCSSYIESGSEYVQCIAKNLAELGLKTDNILNRIGTPYLLICDIPLNLIDERALQNIVNKCLYDAFRDLIDDMNGYIPMAGIAIQTGVNAEYMKSAIEVPML